MAKCTSKLPDDLLKKLSKVGSNMDVIAEEALKAGGEVVLSKTKANLESVIGKNTTAESRSTGELVNSLGLSPVMLDKQGNYNIKIGFGEPRKDGKSNAMIANIIEYGKHGQPAKPFLKPAKTSSKKECEQTMIRVIEEEIKKL